MISENFKALEEDSEIVTKPQERFLRLSLNKIKKLLTQYIIFEVDGGQCPALIDNGSAPDPGALTFFTWELAIMLELTFYTLF